MTTLSDTSANTALSVDEQRKKYITGGLSGFVNIGNTCYMNAALQCLMATRVFAGYFRQGTYKNDLKYGIANKLIKEKEKAEKDKSNELHKIKKSYIKKQIKKSITYRFKRLVKLHWGTNNNIRPQNFKEAIGKMNPIFAGFSQNDSQEFISCLLDLIHEETKSDVLIEFKNISKELMEYKDTKSYYSKLVSDKNTSLEDKIKYKEEFIYYRSEHLFEETVTKSQTYWKKFLKDNHSVIIDIFMGLYIQNVICSECNMQSFSFQPGNILSLGFQKSSQSITLDECLKDYFVNPETLTGENSYSCEKCVKKTNATKKSYIWESPSVLIIQLKRFYNVGPVTHRNDRIVKFPIKDLDMSEYFSEYKKSNAVYDLYGVVHQHGALRGGHYIAYTKNMINGMWYKFDDSHTVHIADDKIHSLIETDGAYLLFYEKRGDVKLVTMEESDEESLL